MGEHELQEALRREAEEKIRALWQEAEALVAARRTELATALEVRRTELERQQEANCAKIRRQVLTLAEQKARQQQLTVDAALEQRLHHLAAEELATLAADRREQLWQSLVGELPKLSWQTVTVHSADARRARQQFPAATVTVDDALVGGLLAATADNRMMVDNSLAGRLARCWPELLLVLVADLHKEVEADAPACPATDR